MKHRVHIVLLCVVLLLSLAAAPAPPRPARRPNVVFVLIDDMGYADLSSYGQRAIATPHIDQLAKEGIRFTQFYVNAPICSPSRAALLTGQYPGRWRITSFLAERAMNERRGMAQWLDPAAPSIGRAMRDAGYATGHFGKWHLGGQRDVGEAPLISEYGFDRSITNFEGLGDRFLPLLDAYDGTPARRYALGSDKLGRGKITWIERSKITAAYTKQAIDFLKAASERDQPAYVNLWLDDVHSPFFPPAALRGDGSKHELYLGVVKATDDQLAVLFDAVRSDPNLRGNTLIILASDNGPERGAGSAGTFRGAKGSLLEGGIREPLIVWGPGVLPTGAAGTVDDTSVIAGIDLFPSVLAIAGVAPPDGVKLDGESRAGSLLGTNPTPRGGPIFWLRPPDRPGPPKADWPDLATRDGKWKLGTDYDGAHPRLYDLDADPGEKADLAAREPARVEAMRAPLLAWYQQMPDSKRDRGAAAEKPE